MTIPDMCLSVKDLYNRYRLGTLPAEFVRSVLYDECDDFDSVLANYLPEYDLVDCSNELAKLRQKFDIMHAASVRKSSPATPVAGEANDVGEKLSETPTT